MNRQSATLGGQGIIWGVHLKSGNYGHEWNDSHPVALLSELSQREMLTGKEWEECTWRLAEWRRLTKQSTS